MFSITINNFGKHCFIPPQSQSPESSSHPTPVPPEMIRTVRHYIDVPLIVGGGIRSREQALAAASAGADIIVTGNVVEETGIKRKVSEIIEGIRRGKT